MLQWKMERSGWQHTFLPQLRENGFASIDVLVATYRNKLRRIILEAKVIMDLNVIDNDSIIIEIHPEQFATLQGEMHDVMNLAYIGGTGRNLDVDWTIFGVNVKVNPRCPQNHLLIRRKN